MKATRREPMPIEWKCRNCHQMGQFYAAPSDSAEEIAATIAEAHAIASEDCHLAHGTSGCYTRG
jgi:hypothetical protein